MLTRILIVPLLLLIHLGQAHATGDKWVDAISLSLGKDENSNETNAFRLGVQNKWNRTLFNGGAWFVGGYWDLALAYMESDIDESDLYDLSITPVLRLQRDASLSSGVTPFSEIGIGAHLRDAAHPMADVNADHRRLQRTNLSGR